MITQERLKELLTYNPETGLFVWKVSRGKKKAGSFAGDICPSTGYSRIVIDYREYRAQKLAWLYVYGIMADDIIDHINHNRTDNRINNLRNVSIKENLKNKAKGKNNKSGQVGVCWRKSTNRWRAYIKVDKKCIELGSFVSFSDAVNARKNAEVLYGFHENHGKDK